MRRPIVVEPRVEEVVERMSIWGQKMSLRGLSDLAGKAVRLTDLVRNLNLYVL